MNVKIEKNVPLPPKMNEWDFMGTMKVNDSVFMKSDNLKNLTSRIIAAAKYRDIRVSIRREKDGIRFWKTAATRTAPKAKAKAAGK